MSNDLKTHSIPISEGTQAETILYRLKRGTTLRLHPETALLGKELVLNTNFPEEGN